MLSIGIISVLVNSIFKEECTMLKNRKSMAKIVVLFCIAALTAFASIAQADAGGCGGENGAKHQRHNFKKLAMKLSLTDAQKAQAKAIFLGNRDIVRPIFTSLQVEQKNLRALMHADTVDVAAIRAQTAKISSIQADLNVNRARVGAEFRAILTPAQLVTLKTLHKKSQPKDDATNIPAE
jgi:periplasmic protein CpxP/Spy